MSRGWLTSEQRILREMFNTVPDGVIADRLDRSRGAIRAKAKELGLIRDRVLKTDINGPIVLREKRVKTFYIKDIQKFNEFVSTMTKKD